MVGARFQHGALDIESIETKPVMKGDQPTDITPQEKNRATSLIEEFMVAANGVMARHFEDAKVASIRRVVRVPKRWDRIVQLAEGLGTKLPAEPDSKALNEFLLERKKADPVTFPDLSLSVVKLMGPGEYVLVRPGVESPGHFGLAVQDYTHSTAPNRRFPDMVAQRILKALIANAQKPYSEEQLGAIATRCTEMEDAARHVERDMEKRIAAVVLHPRIGQVFNGIITGVNQHGTFVRALDPHVEGMLVHGKEGLDVGDRVRVKLVGTNPARGFIDFAAV
jgi:exoribonuclease-2